MSLFRKIILYFVTTTAIAASAATAAAADDVYIKNSHIPQECSCSFYKESFDSFAGWERIDNRGDWIANSAVYTVNAPGSGHGKAARIVTDASQSGFFGKKYNIITDMFKSGELKRMRFSCDVYFDGFSPILISSLDSNKAWNEMVSVSETGELSINNGKSTDEINYNKYKQLEQQVWYEFTVDFDLENNAYSFFINKEIIVNNASVISGGSDIIHVRIFDMKSTVCDGNILYIDNWNLQVNQSELSQIHLDLRNDGTACAYMNAYGKEYASGKMIIASYDEGGRLKKCGTGTGERHEDIIYFSAETQLDEGDTVKAFVLENGGSVKPLVSSGRRKLYTDKDFEQLREKWRKALTANDYVNLQSPNVKAMLKRIDDSGKNSYYNIDADASYPMDPWGQTVTTTSQMTNAFSRVYNLARAYASPGESYHNPKYYDMLIKCLDYMYENFYGDDEINGTGWKSTEDYSWWDWFVGSPRFLIDSLMMNNDVLNTAQIEKYLSLFIYLRDNMQGIPEKSRIYGVYASAVLLNDRETLLNIENYIPQIFEYSDNQIGMREDGSYIDHNNHPLTGMYGTALLDRYIRIYNIVKGTPFEGPVYYEQQYKKWMDEAFAPVLVNGGIMSMVNGRGIDYLSSEYDFGILIIEAALGSINNSIYPDEFKSMVKRNMTESSLQYMYKNLSVNSISTLEDIMEDSSIDITPSVKSKVYAGMDRVVHHADGWTAGIAMSSSRVANYESIDLVNKKAWYTGDGMVYLYPDKSGQEYDLDFWKGLNYYRIPGTTADTQERDAISIMYGNEYFSSKDFVGGASDGEITAAAMDLESFHNDVYKPITDNPNGTNQPLHDCTLTAEKSWFIFDNEIVALGNNINANDGFEVCTYVENRAEAGEVKKSNNFVHVENAGGYYFPDEKALYDNISENGYYELWLSHGINPSNQKYAYVMLPNMTYDETVNYTANPDIEILSNTDTLQAVHEKTTNSTGYVFRKSGSFGDISVSEPIILLIRKRENNVWEISVADPTQKLSGATVRINGKFKILENDEHITLKNSEKSILNIDLSGSAGKTFKVVLAEKN